MKRGITFGTFDVFHYGHLRILERTRELCDHLVVGVSSDELNFSKKGRNPWYSYEERARIVGALRCVDEVFREDWNDAARSVFRDGMTSPAELIEYAYDLVESVHGSVDD